MEIETDIFIPKVVKSLNKFKGRHWASYKKIKDGWHHDLGFIIRRGHHNNRKRRAMIISYHAGAKFYDPDNHKAGCKPILDTLKDMGWIKDDNANWFNCRYSQRRSGNDGTKMPGTRIIIYKQKEEAQKIKKLKLCRLCLMDFAEMAWWDLVLEEDWFNHEITDPRPPGPCDWCRSPATIGLMLEIDYETTTKTETSQ